MVVNYAGSQEKAAAAVHEIESAGAKVIAVQADMSNKQCRSAKSLSELARRKMMRAVVVTEMGEAEVLQVKDIPEPQPGAGQITINVAFAAVGLVDVLVRRGEFNTPLPFVPGFEVAGYVRALGEGINHLRVGQPVAAMLYQNMGGYAEVASTAAALSIPLDGLDKPLNLETAAAFLGNATTAYLALTTVVSLCPGQTVLVHGATGGLGSALGQIARQLGASQVLGTVSNRNQEEYAKSLGYDTIVLARNFVTEVKEATKGRGVDLVLDPVGGTLRAKSLDVLSSFGCLVLLGNASGEADVPQSSNNLWLRNKGVIGFNLGGLSREAPNRVADAAQKALSLVAHGKLRTDKTEVLPIEQAVEAHRRLEQRKNMGKLILRLNY